MNSKKIVITGGPSTGKTALIEALEQEGFKCFHEIIRTLTAKAREEGTTKRQVSNPLVFVDDPLEFNTTLLEGRLKQLLDAANLNVSQCFFDRGTPDVLAYMDFFKQEYDKTFEKVCEENRYDTIYILPPWRAIYVRDNERLETFEEAQVLHQCLFETYQRFGYDPKIVPPASISERLNFIISDSNKLS